MSCSSHQLYDVFFRHFSPCEIPHASRIVRFSRMRVENRTMGRLDVRLETRDIDGVYFNSYSKVTLLMESQILPLASSHQGMS